MSVILSVCLSIEWSEWFYGNCHVTCGSGNTTRIRHCSTGNDVDCGNESSVETVACNGGPCPGKMSDL